MDTCFSSSRDPVSQMDLVTLSNAHCQVVVAPDIGGRIVSFIPSVTGEDVLWHNKTLPLFRSRPGDAYDPVFYGGIDELLPCDLPETIDGIDYPDHGELWTTPLQWEASGDRLRLWGVLPRSGLFYEREMTLSQERPEIVFHYRIQNRQKEPRHFLWKLHAALHVLPGDRVTCPASTAQAADLAYSSCTTPDPFAWPFCDGIDKSVVPEENGTCEFLYLSGLSTGTMGLDRPSTGTVDANCPCAESAHPCRSVPAISIRYEFDRAVFPFPWLFASFGGFDGHFVTVLEPCTNMPISVADAQQAGTSAMLAPGEVLVTTVRLTVQLEGSS